MSKRLKKILKYDMLITVTFVIMTGFIIISNVYIFDGVIGSFISTFSILMLTNAVVSITEPVWMK